MSSSFVEAVTEVVGFIGCGMMGQALLGGMMKKGVIKPGNVWAADPYTNFTSIEWVSEYKVHTTVDNVEAIKHSDIVFLAVKPFLLEGLLNDLTKAGVSLEGKMIISMVSGFDLERLRSFKIGTDRIIRIMPNIPALYQEGSTALCAMPDVSKKDLDFAKKLMDAVGKSWVIPENRMNVWTACTGAGPAYVFLFLEAIADAAVVGGIPRDVANEMAAQLVYGSCKMVMESGKHVAQLRDNVCSPGGVTIAGVQRLQEKAFPGVGKSETCQKYTSPCLIPVMNAVAAAKERYDVVNANPNA